MQIVIEVPEKIACEGFERTFTEEEKSILIRAIGNGTPLPKGHGDLKDMDDIYEALEGWDDDTGWIVDAIDCQAPTIIEADKGESKVEE